MRQNEFIEMLVRKGALKVASDRSSLFVFKSGRRSPNFINIGALTDGESLLALKNAYTDCILRALNEKKLEPFDFIFGPAYKGINLACLACEGLFERGVNVRYLYDRKEVKAYADSTEQAIVGAGFFTHGARILIIDDVITTGGTKLEALEKLKMLGDHKVVGLVLAVDRQERMGSDTVVEEKSAVQHIESLGIPVFAILDMESIFSAVKDAAPADVRNAWIEYYEKYGVVKLNA